MSILEKIRRATDASRVLGRVTIVESHGQLMVFGRLEPVALQLWGDVFDDLPGWLSFRCLDEGDASVSLRSVTAGEALRIFLTFERVSGAVHLFTAEGWRSFLHDVDENDLSSTIRLACEMSPFTTAAFSVDQWVTEPTAAEARAPAPDMAPRRLVRSQSRDFMPPADLRPWLLKTKPAASSQPFEDWRNLAIVRIAVCLANELYVEDARKKVLIAGQPPRRLSVEQDFALSSSQFDTMQNAAQWVYSSGTDIEPRHTFLSTELARNWDGSVSFLTGLKSKLEVSLEGARLAYRSHLRSSSKETIKGLADLRKTLGDEIQKIMQYTKDLSASVWRDTAVALGALGLKAGFDSSKASANSQLFGYVFGALFIYLITSYVIQVRANREFFDVVETTRRSWRSKLYSFLDDDDYQSLAETPVKDAIAIYKNAEIRTRNIVAVSSLAVLFLSLSEFQLIDMRMIIFVSAQYTASILVHILQILHWIIRDGIWWTVSNLIYALRGQ